MPNSLNTRDLYERCVTQCAESLYRVAFRLTGDETTASDLVQETCLHAWQNIDSLRNPDRIRSWIFSILRNRFSKHVRQQIKFPLEENDVQTLPDEYTQRKEISREKEILKDRVQQAVSQLNDEHRMPILLVSMEGLSVSEAAEILEIPEGTVMSRLHRGRKKLKDLIKHERSTIG